MLNLNPLSQFVGSYVSLFHQEKYQKLNLCNCKSVSSVKLQWVPTHFKLGWKDFKGDFDCLNLKFVLFKTTKQMLHDVDEPVENNTKYWVQFQKTQHSKCSNGCHLRNVPILTMYPSDVFGNLLIQKEWNLMFVLVLLHWRFSEEKLNCNRRDFEVVNGMRLDDTVDGTSKWKVGKKCTTEVNDRPPSHEKISKSKQKHVRQNVDDRNESWKKLNNVVNLQENIYLRQMSQNSEKLKSENDWESLTKFDRWFILVFTGQKNDIQNF